MTSPMGRREMLFRSGRAAVLFVISILLVMMGVGSLFGQRGTIEAEHRFTAIETRLEDMATDIHDIKARLEQSRSGEWLKLMALAGLVGEAGMRTLKRRSKTDDE